MKNVSSGDPQGWLYNIVPTTIESTDPKNKASKSGLELFFLKMDGNTFSAKIEFPPYFYIGLDSRREPALETYLRNKFGDKITETTIVDKQDLDLANHLAGLTHRFLRVSFHNIRDLMDVRNFLRQHIKQKTDLSDEDMLHLYTLPSDINSTDVTLINVESGRNLSKSSSKGSNNDSKQEESLKLINASVLSNLQELRESTVPYYERFCIDRNVRCGYWYRVETDENFKANLVHLADLQDRPQTVVLAYDIETCKAPLKFPNAEYDPIMMISYMLDTKGFLIVNREVVSEDIEPFEYTPKDDFVGKFEIFNEPDEKSLIKRFFNHIKLVKPQIFVTFNGDFFDWPYVEKRAEFHGIHMFDEIGVKANNNGEYTSKHAPHLDCFCWVKRDSYLPQGSQGLKKVTKAKLGYDPLELDPEDMTPFASSKPQVLASYSVSDAVATYYLYMKYVHPFIFSLCTIIPLNPDDVLRKGSGTLCEALLMVQAYQENVIFPDKKLSNPEEFYRGHLLQAGTYIGGHVEALRSGVFRSDIPTQFEMDPTAFQMLIDSIDPMLEFTIQHEGHFRMDEITNYDEVKAAIIEELKALRDQPKRCEHPMIYHLDVSAMYPNIILTNRLQPSAMVSDTDCASCDFFEPNATCQRKMTWVWRGEMFPATQSEYRLIKTQLESEYVNVTYTDEDFQKLVKSTRGGSSYDNSTYKQSRGYRPVQRNFAKPDTPGSFKTGEFISFDTTNTKQTPLEFHQQGYSDFDLKPGKIAGTVIVSRPFKDLELERQMPFMIERLKLFSQKVHKKQTHKVIKRRKNTICQRENSFYVDTVRLFRDRRYEYKKLLKSYQKKLRAVAGTNKIDEITLAKDRIVLYDSLQLAHKCILNSFYGYVMRKGARWYSMEMAGIVTHTGGNIIKMARRLVERVGFGLELDTDGIWCCLPRSFPEDFTFKTSRPDKPSYEISYPCIMLNYNVWTHFTNDQYATLQEDNSYSAHSENSIEFEVDGPYLAMILPASQDEGRKLKKRYAVFNEDHSLAELKGFEIKRRGELQLVKIFQSQVFKAFLRGNNLQECYDAVGSVANRWLDVLYTRGNQVTSDYIIDLLSENRVMSRPLADYEGQKSTSITCAKRLASFLGNQMVSSSGLAVSYVISREPESAPTSDRAIPIAIWNTDEKTKQSWLCTWCNNPDMMSFDIRTILDWDYYTTRLGAAIQKIITIPAALQSIPNPVPRCEHPPWVLKLIKDRTSKQQKPIEAYFQQDATLVENDSVDIFADISNEEIEPQSDKDLLPAEGEEIDANLETDGQMMLPQYSPQSGALETKQKSIRKSRFRSWIIQSKSKWSSVYPENFAGEFTVNDSESFLQMIPKDSRQKLSKIFRSWAKKTHQTSKDHQVPIDDSVNPIDSDIFLPPLPKDSLTPTKKNNGLTGMVQTELERKAILLANTWHVLKVSPTSNSAVSDVLIFIPTHGLFNISVTTPRKIYLHTWYPLPSSSPISEIAPNIVFKTLPHGIPRIELRELVLPESAWKQNTTQFQTLFTTLGVQGFYESKSPLSFKTEVKIGATVSIQPISHASIIFSRRFGEFNLDDIIREPASSSYLPNSSLSGTIPRFSSGKPKTPGNLTQARDKSNSKLVQWSHFAIFHLSLKGHLLLAVYDRESQQCILFITDCRWPNVNLLQDALSLESAEKVAKQESQRILSAELADGSRSGNKVKKPKKRKPKKTKTKSQLNSSTILFNNGGKENIQPSDTIGDESFSSLFVAEGAEDSESESESDDSRNEDAFLINLFDENAEISSQTLDGGQDDPFLTSTSSDLPINTKIHENSVSEDDSQSSQPLFSHKSTFLIRRFSTNSALISSFSRYCQSKFNSSGNPSMIGYSSNSQQFFPSILEWNTLPTWQIPWYPIDSWTRSSESLHWSVISSLWLCSTIKLFDKSWEHALSLSRYANIPIGNLDSWDFHPLDILLGRKLSEFDHISWASDTSLPDLGLTPSVEIIPKDDPLQKYLSVSNPGLYLNTVCTVKVSHLFLQALLLNLSTGSGSASRYTLGRGTTKNKNPDEQRKSILMNHNISSTMIIIQEIVKSLGTDILENRGGEAPQMLLDALIGFIQNHKSLLHDHLISAEVLKTTIRLFRGLLGELQLLGCKIIGATIHSITFETPKEDFAIAQAFIRQAFRQIKRKRLFSWIELTPTMYFDTLLFLNAKNYSGVAFLNFPPLFPKSRRKANRPEDVVDISQVTPQLYPQWDILRFLPPETHQYFTQLLNQFVSELYSYKTGEISWNPRLKRLSPDIDIDGTPDVESGSQLPHSAKTKNRIENDKALKNPVIQPSRRQAKTQKNGRVDNDTLFVIGNHLLSKELAPFLYAAVDEIRAKFRNSQLSSEGVALKYVVFICHVLGSCSELSLIVDDIKNNLLRLLSVAAYSKESEFVNPYASHTILTHTCVFCLNSFEFDPLIDLLLCPLCNMPIDLMELEQRLLYLFDSTIIRIFGSDMPHGVSKQLRTIALSHWRAENGKTVNYTSFSSSDEIIQFQRKFSYFCQVAKKLNFSILAKVIQSIFD